LLAVQVTPANASDRAQVAALAEEVQSVTEQTVELGFVDQGYSGEQAATAAAQHEIRLEVIKLSEAKKGFVLLPRHRVVERSFAWAAGFRRLAKDYDRLPETVAGLHFVAFACLMLHRLVTVAAQSPEHALDERAFLAHSRDQRQGRRRDSFRCASASDQSAHPNMYKYGCTRKRCVPW
jgi:transposase